MENEAINRQIILSLKEKVASQEELILLLKHENDELKSQIKHSDESQCPNLSKIRQLESELELNIVDLKVFAIFVEQKNFDKVMPSTFLSIFNQ